MRHWNSIAGVLLSPDLVFVPWLEEEEARELPKGNRWARGFLRGIEVCRDDWDEIFADDDKFAMLLSVMALFHENDPDPEMRTWKTPPSLKIREHCARGTLCVISTALRLLPVASPSRSAARNAVPLRQHKNKNRAQ